MIESPQSDLIYIEKTIIQRISINLGDEDNSTASTQAHPPHILIKQPNHSKKE